MLHCNYPLLTTTKGYHFASCENIPSPSQTLSLPPSPSPPPPAPILLEKGCGQQEGINGIGKQTAEEKLDADNVGIPRH